MVSRSPSWPAPELLRYIHSRIDQKRSKTAKWFFTGSPLLQGVTESMAGRAAILQLLPSSVSETDRVGLLSGGYPEAQVNQGRRKELYHFRDQQGLEVDFLFPDGKGALWMVECRASKTVMPSMAGPLHALRRAMKNGGRAAIVHQKAKDPLPSRSVAPGIEALDIRDLLSAIKRQGRKTK